MEEFSTRELQCFLAIAEERSFTRAAERLGLSQPPLSRHIRNLEERVGASLFERSRREVSLTPAGQAFLEESREILPQMARAAESARRAGSGEIDRLEVGFVSAVLSPELVDVFSRFRSCHPGIQLHLHDRLPSEQIAALVEGELDLAFVGVAPPRLPGGLALSDWMEEPLMVFLPPGHPEAGRKSITMGRIAEEPFVMIATEAAPGFVAHVRSLCQAAGFRPRIVQEARRAQAVAAMTIAGTGVAILPASVDRLTGNGVPLVEEGRRASRIRLKVAHRERPGEIVSMFLEAL